MSVLPGRRASVASATADMVSSAAVCTEHYVSRSGQRDVSRLCRSRCSSIRFSSLALAHAAPAFARSARRVLTRVVGRRRAFVLHGGVIVSAGCPLVTALAALERLQRMLMSVAGVPFGVSVMRGVMRVTGAMPLEEFGDLTDALLGGVRTDAGLLAGAAQIAP